MLCMTHRTHIKYISCQPIYSRLLLIFLNQTLKKQFCFRHTDEAATVGNGQILLLKYTTEETCCQVTKEGEQFDEN